MKKIFIAAIMICFYHVSIGQDISKLDAKNGFRDAIFGTNVTEFKNLVKVDEAGDKVYYKRTTDDLKLGDYQLKNISYGFYKNKLYCVMISIEGYSNSRGVLGILQAAYGKGSQDNEYIEEYVWFGSVVYMDYDENSITKNSHVFITNNEISDLIQADKEKAANEAAKGL